MSGNDSYLCEIMHGDCFVVLWWFDDFEGDFDLNGGLRVEKGAPGGFKGSGMDSVMM